MPGAPTTFPTSGRAAEPTWRSLTRLTMCALAGWSVAARQSNSEFAMASGEMSSPDFVRFLGTVLDAAAAVSRDGAVHFVCMDWRHIGELLTAAKAIYGATLNLVVWAKTNAGQRPVDRSAHELIGVFRVGEADHLTN